MRLLRRRAYGFEFENMHSRGANATYPMMKIFPWKRKNSLLDVTL
ncbi:hypothetical protein BH23CHL5_BH23CHL5_05330 [soil metagenome]